MFFKSQEGKEKILNLYNQKLNELDIEYSEKRIETSFGNTNIIITGDVKQPSVRPGDTWKAPNYSTFDASLRHGFTLGEFDTTLTARVNNVFNTEYIADALDASDPLVWFGYGRTFSLSAKIKF